MERLKVLRASTIGFPCDRHLWYSAEGYKRQEDPKALRIFAVGTALEPVAVEIRGHLDAIISRPGMGHMLVDIKTMNDRSFMRWKREGTETKSPQYMDQLHVYADAAISQGLAVDKLGIVGINKNNSEMRIDIFDYSIERMVELRVRAERIFAATAEAPEPGPRLASWACNYCAYRHVCDIHAAKADTSVGEDIAVTTDGDVINALSLLRESRDLEKTAKDLSDEAKRVLDDKVRKAGIKSVCGGGLILTLDELKKAIAAGKKILADRDARELGRREVA